MKELLLDNTMFLDNKQYKAVSEFVKRINSGYLIYDGDNPKNLHNQTQLVRSLLYEALFVLGDTP